MEVFKIKPTTYKFVLYSDNASDYASIMLCLMQTFLNDDFEEVSLYHIFLYALKYTLTQNIRLLYICS